MRLGRLPRDQRPTESESLDYRYNFGYFALVPVGLTAGIQLGHSVFGKSHPGILWLLLGAVGTVFYFGSLLWGRLVPAAVSLSLGLIGWTVVLWMAWHNHL